MSRWVHAALIALGLLSASAAQADNGPSQTYYAPSGAAPFVPWNGTTIASPAYTTPAGTNQYALTLVTAKTLTVPAGTKVATVTVEGQPIRCTTDGTTTPTSTVGSVFPVGAVFSVYQTALASLSCIQTASAATVDVEYFK